MESRAVEVSVGLFVALGMAALLMLAVKVSNLSEFASADGYAITARFGNVGGLKERSAVSMAGVRVGRVSRIDFDDETYEAVVTLEIASRHDRIPVDSSARIFTAGLLGEQYIGIEAGGEEEYLEDGSEIELTQSAVILEQLIGKLLYDKASQSGPATGGGG